MDFFETFLTGAWNLWVFSQQLLIVDVFFMKMC